MGIKFKSKGDWEKTTKFVKKCTKIEIEKILQKYGEEGVSALRAGTPYDTGNTANSWSYIVEQDGSSWSVTFNNSNVNKGVNIALILQFGHGTGTGGYVAGRDYINPALQPVFDDLVKEAWEEIISYG